MSGKEQTIFSKLILALIGFILFFGGLGYGAGIVLALGGVGSVTLLAFVVYKKGKIRFPKGFLIYCLFLVLFALSLLWSLNWQKSLGYLVLYVSGGVFWVTFFNLKGISKNFIENIVLILGILFGIFALAYKYLNFAPFGRAPFSLVFPVSGVHHHIGDFWAIVLVFVIYKTFVQRKYFYSLLFLPGVYFLIISLSRAAYVTFAAGASLIFYYKGWFQKYRKILALFFVLVAGLFLFAGAQKTTLFSRPYFLQAVGGLINYPFGTGYGNFESISTECFGCFNDKLASFSSVAHNLVLEILVGMGVLGASFIYWLYKVLESLLTSLDDKNIVFAAAFFALLTNFLFDFTYTIPTMFWLLFIFLGIAQKGNEQSKGGVFFLYVLSAFLIIASLLFSFGLLRFNLLT